MPDQPIDIRKWFIDRPDPPPNTYELALVLGGTVPAGCYTASGKPRPLAQRRARSVDLPERHRTAMEGGIGAELRGLWWGKFVGWFGGLVAEGQAADFCDPENGRGHKRVGPRPLSLFDQA
jgi:hypothetical protein